MNKTLLYSSSTVTQTRVLRRSFSETLQISTQRAISPSENSNELNKAGHQSLERLSTAVKTSTSVKKSQFRLGNLTTVDRTSWLSSEQSQNERSLSQSLEQTCGMVQRQKQHALFPKYQKLSQKLQDLLEICKLLHFSFAFHFWLCVRKINDHVFLIPLRRRRIIEFASQNTAADVYL